MAVGVAIKCSDGIVLACDPCVPLSGEDWFFHLVCEIEVVFQSNSKDG